ncbi:MAG: 50S ribosomal protein L20 [Candidatus Paceibacterota bacterium]|jgi:large subunit ribosomal protein L20|nr:50S ribosomal protein L20 [Candidatus Paceibacterota bacterium]MDD4830632.1 50S ribosomal protein L20 [Candidatus Paceibacterota bacterium]MDD4875178.1 50S ribosomal protein L20 [Candidatus Paceibacterota bacterium]
MVRVKRGVAANKRRKNTIKEAKGFKWGRKSKFKSAKLALMKARKYAYRDRKVRKRTARALWQVHISFAVREEGLSYSRFIDSLKKANIELDRKILSSLASKNPEIFKAVVAKVK